MKKIEEIRRLKGMECKACAREFTLRIATGPEQKQNYFCPYCFKEDVVIRNQIKFTVTSSTSFEF